MENLSYSSYTHSHDSLPSYREIDSENQSWDELPSNYKVKFMCSYGGKIQPRPHDNQLAYIGGDTKILSVDRKINFSAIMGKISSLCDTANVCFKYQLPGEDLDALISVTNDEDLDHMMLEYDRMYRALSKPTRLRLFLFPLNYPVAAVATNEPKPDRQWFVNSLNSVQIQSLEGSSPPAVAVAEGKPDFLLGLDKGYAAVPAPNFHDSTPAPTIPEVVVSKDVSAGSDCESEDRYVIGEPVVSPAEIQRQIHQLQRLQIAAGHEQTVLQRKIDEGNAGGYIAGDYYGQKNIAPVAGAAPIPLQMPIPARYTLQERHMTSCGYPVAAAPTGTEQPVYLIPTGPAGSVYQSPSALLPMTGPAGGQTYYGVQRVVQEMYREQPVYNAVPTTGSIQQQPNALYNTPKGGGAEPGYVQLGYDNAGRQLYGVVPQYQAVAPLALDGMHSDGTNGGGLNQDGKVFVNATASQTSSL